MRRRVRLEGVLVVRAASGAAAGASCWQCELRWQTTGLVPVACVVVTCKVWRAAEKGGAKWGSAPTKAHQKVARVLSRSRPLSAPCLSSTRSDSIKTRSKLQVCPSPGADYPRVQSDQNGSHSASSAPIRSGTFSHPTCTSPRSNTAACLTYSTCLPPLADARPQATARAQVVRRFE